MLSEETQPFSNVTFRVSSLILYELKPGSAPALMEPYTRLLQIMVIYHVAVVNQFYEAEIMTEYVIRGNTALLKCSIPSFVADFVQVESWVDNSGHTYITSNDYGNDLHTSSSFTVVSLHALIAFQILYFIGVTLDMTIMISVLHL
jgi:hypothetical protein